MSIIPVFIGDGISEEYMDREYRDHDGNVVLDLDSEYLSTHVMEPKM